MSMLTNRFKLSYDPRPIWVCEYRRSNAHIHADRVREPTSTPLHVFSNEQRR